MSEGHARAAADVLCLGESMVLGASGRGLSLAVSPDVELHVAGAESNVACGLAHLGHDVEWFSRLGDDPFGSRIRATLGDRGVGLDGVVTDPERPTGLYFKELGETGSRVLYYRAGSAASALGPDDLASLRLPARRLCHVSGITAALSASCDALLQALLVERAHGARTISFDVNHRPTLWDAATAGPRLLELARAADIVLVGRDEAEALWGTPDVDAIRALFPDVGHLVVKDADRQASHVGRGPDGTDRRTDVGALAVEVVEAIGAGDAFAAGYLSGWLSGASAEAALRLGHVMAGFTLRHLGDLPPLPGPARIRELAATSAEDWGALSLSGHDPRESSSQEPVSQEPVSQEPVSQEPGTGQSGTGQSGTGQSGTGRSGIQWSGPQRSSTEEPSEQQHETRSGR